MSIFETFYPPPWNILDNREKTEGWIEFQRALNRGEYNEYIIELNSKV